MTQDIQNFQNYLTLLQWGAYLTIFNTILLLILIATRKGDRDRQEGRDRWKDHR